MNNHIELVCRGVDKTIREKRSVWRSVWLFIFFIVQTTCIIAQTGNQQYALNDPRNPDCPCHKYQKQAEEEYKQQQQKMENSQLAMNTINIKEDNNAEEESQTAKRFTGKQHSLKTHTASSGKRSKRKGAQTWILKMRKLFFHKHSKIKHFSPKYGICFKW